MPCKEKSHSKKVSRMIKPGALRGAAIERPARRGSGSRKEIPGQAGNDIRLKRGEGIPLPTLFSKTSLDPSFHSG